MTFQRIYSGAPWEEAVGYCRVLRAGNLVFVTGTASVDPNGEVHAPGDALAQARRCLAIIKGSLEKLGVGMDSIVRTRMFTTDIDRWEDYGLAHKEVFGEHPPTTTLVEVARLIHPDMLIEIEADAVVEER
jgi:enamine deaminase RidA (YjgF/YER057c/UK114 family)